MGGLVPSPGDTGVKDLADFQQRFPPLGITHQILPDVFDFIRRTELENETEATIAPCLLPTGKRHSVSRENRLHLLLEVRLEGWQLALPEEEPEASYRGFGGQTFGREEHRKDHCSCNGQQSAVGSQQSAENSDH